MKKKTALVVEGGAMRSTFSAGLLDAFLVERFNPFDLCIGVSAGICNVASYLAEQYLRNKIIIENYSRSPKFISLTNFLRGRHFFDLDWLWDIIIKEIRLDFKTIFSKKKEFIVIVTSIESGRAIHLEPNENNLEDYLKASCSIPLLYRNFLEINSERVTDGGIADPIPVIEAYRRGARKIMVIRSRKATQVLTNNFSTRFYSRLFKEHPNLQKAILNRATEYRKAIDFSDNPPEDAEILHLTPPDAFRSKRTTTDLKILQADYQLGFDQGKLAIQQFNSLNSQA